MAEKANDKIVYDLELFRNIKVEIRNNSDTYRESSIDRIIRMAAAALTTLKTGYITAKNAAKF